MKNYFRELFKENISTINNLINLTVYLFVCLFVVSMRGWGKQVRQVEKLVFNVMIYFCCCCWTIYIFLFIFIFFFISKV